MLESGLSSARVGVMRRETSYFFFILPALIVLILIIAFPFVFNLYLSFMRWDLRYRGALPQFIGIDNYVKALQDARLFNSLNKTFYLLIVAVPLEFLFGLLLAVVFFEPFRLRRLVSAFILFPLALSEAVVGLVWGLILVPTYGPFDLFMKTFGLWQLLGYEKSVSLITTYPMETIIVADMWQWTPFFFLVLLAGFASVPKEILESAEIDGAGKVDTVRYMMLPVTKPIIGVALVMRIMDVFKTFGIPYVMTKGGPGFASEVVSLYIFNQALQFLNVTYAATLTMLVIILITVILTAFVRGFGIRF